MKNFMPAFWNSEWTYLNQALLFKASNSEPTLRSWARNVLYTFVGHFAFQKWYFKNYSWKSTRNIEEKYVLQPKVGNFNIQDIPHSDERLWKQTVDGMMTHWGFVRKGAALAILSVHHILRIILIPTWILRLPIALLRLSVVMGNAILRTMSILAFLLAASSVATASILIASREQLNSATKRDRWIDASTCPKLLSSIDFWTCLTFPITSFVWWVILMWLTCEFMISGHAGRYCCPF